MNHPFKKIQTFTKRYPFAGPIIWILSLQYFIVQLFVAKAWMEPYSLLHNTISDLGNTACSNYGIRPVCSPLHTWMNVSFVLLGTTMAIGSLLIFQEFKKNLATRLGFSFMAVAGFGTILVGLFPENSISLIHGLGAALPFLVGNIGIVILGCYLDISISLKLYTLASGVVALVALLLFTTHNYLGLDIGGMERLTAYPQTIWLIVFGIYITRNHRKKY